MLWSGMQYLLKSSDAFRAHGNDLGENVHFLRPLQVKINQQRGQLVDAKIQFNATETVWRLRWHEFLFLLLCETRGFLAPTWTRCTEWETEVCSRGERRSKAHRIGTFDGVSFGIEKEAAAAVAAAAFAAAKQLTAARERERIIAFCENHAQR